MESLMRNSNPGLKRRFQPEEAIIFDDYTDGELLKILLLMVRKCGLLIKPVAARDVIRIISQQRRLEGFGNAGTVSNYLGRAKLNRSKRAEIAAIAGEAFNSEELLLEDFLAVDDKVSTANVLESMDEAGLCNIDHIAEFIDKLQITVSAALADGAEPADILSKQHMVFTGSPGKAMRVSFMIDNYTY